MNVSLYLGRLFPSGRIEGSERIPWALQLRDSLRARTRLRLGPMQLRVHHLSRGSYDLGILDELRGCTPEYDLIEEYDSD